MRTKFALYNIIISIFRQAITIILGLITLQMILKHFGSEVNGLVSSLNMFFTYVNLLQAGIAVASIQALFAPLAAKDTNQINGIMSATNKYFNRMGVYFVICVVAMAVFYPIAIKSTIDKSIIISLILIIGLGMVLDYLFQSTCSTILSADSRVFVITSFDAVTVILSNLSVIILMMLGFNIIIVQFSFTLAKIIKAIILKKYVDHKYKYLNLKTKPNFAAISQRKNAFVHQLGSMVLSNTDVIMLSVFCGLKIVSIYTIYNMIFQSLAALNLTIQNSIFAPMGTLFNENKQKFMRFFNMLEVYSAIIYYAVFSVAISMTIPFIKLYTANIDDINYVMYLLPVLFATINLLSSVRMPSNLVINVAGHFKATQNRAIAEMTINLVCSIILVQFFNIYGVLFGTIMALAYRSVDMVIYANKNILSRSSLITLSRNVINLVLLLISCFIYSKIHIVITTYAEWFIVATILSITTFVFFITVNLMIEKEAKASALVYIKNFCQKH
jgi:O-antigen/teichoic acid export membrane protein